MKSLPNSPAGLREGLTGCKSKSALCIWRFRNDEKRALLIRLGTQARLAIKISRALLRSARKE